MHAQVMERQTTVAEYFRRDNAHDYKLEFINGRIIPMAGASALHNDTAGLLTATLVTELFARGCRVWPGDMRVEVDHGASYTYPDIVVVCEEPLYRHKVHPDTLLNPTLIFEILSPSTEDRDRNEKYDQYLRIPSLQGYFLVAQDEPRIETAQRDGNRWIESEHYGLGDTLVINAPACELPMRDIFRHLRF